MNWPAGLKERASAAHNVHDAFLSYGSANKLSDWVKSNKSRYRIVSMVQEMRIKADGE